VGSVDGKTQSIDVLNLKKDTAHHFRITCRNKVGVSLPLAPEETITPKGRFGAPSIPGRPLQVSEMTNTSLTLTWNKPLSTGGIELSGYILERRLISESNWIRVDTIEPQTTSYTVENLSSKHQYFFRVIAENPLGLSPPLETESALKLSLTAGMGLLFTEIFVTIKHQLMKLFCTRSPTGHPYRSARDQSCRAERYSCRMG